MQTNPKQAWSRIQLRGLMTSIAANAAHWSKARPAPIQATEGLARVSKLLDERLAARFEELRQDDLAFRKRMDDPFGTGEGA